MCSSGCKIRLGKLVSSLYIRAASSLSRLYLVRLGVNHGLIFSFVGSFETTAARLEEDVTRKGKSELKKKKSPSGYSLLEWWGLAGEMMSFRG